MEIPTPGQRWTSTTEPELGLGLVLEADISRVRLLFPATGEMRTYAWGSAPLARYQVLVGDRVTDHDGESWVVERVEEDAGCLVYVGAKKRLPESGLEDVVAANGPLDHLLQGSDGVSADFDFREQVLRKVRERSGHPGVGFLGGRIEWLPHQISIAREVSQRIHPRVLLADEVGLGKTIEAGLVLHHAVVTGRAQRILVVVPDALIHQWFVEMLRRFHLTFSIMDAERLARAGEDNPFFDDQCVLCPLNLLTGSPKVQALAEAGEWELMIVDEAHHLAWRSDEASPEYCAVAGLAVSVPGVLLLTATPGQMGDETHYAQLKMLDPDRYPSLEDFREEQLAYVRVAEEAEKLKEAGEDGALRQLLTCHGPGRILFRNTREHIPGFPKRIAHPLYLSTDKTSWLKEFLEARPQEKVLLMTRTPAQVKAISKSLLGFMDPPPVLFHEEQHLLERDRQAAWFADPEGARLMIASDIGGEGRNFQFVRHLILFDLPHDPERIEQRIGRLDRIGQQAEFHIHLPVLADTEEADWLRWLHEGLGAFDRPLTCGKRCLELFQDRLGNVDESLLADTRAMVEKLEAENRSGTQKLLAWKHALAEPDRDLMEALEESDADEALLPFIEKLWGQLGLEMENLREKEFLLKSGPFDKGDLSLRAEGLRFTTDRSLALSREDLDLITWDHPLVREGMDASLQSLQGTAVSAVSPEIERPMLQALFVLEAVAPPAWQVSRYLPAIPLRVTVNAMGRECKVPEILEDAGDISSVLAHTAFRQEWLPDRVHDATRRAQVKSQKIISRALESLTEKMDAEIQRLEDLKNINDHVRDEEVQQLRQQKQDLTEALEKAAPRLDGLRLILPG
ncbi:SNF2-related protein [Kiritimatiellaeota bacterium B1221]|nr:SNF2-related protein [Kiritimatiellaeota bacterium B1221]